MAKTSGTCIWKVPGSNFGVAIGSFQILIPPHDYLLSFRPVTTSSDETASLNHRGIFKGNERTGKITLAVALNGQEGIMNEVEGPGLPVTGFNAGFPKCIK
jgi:hypothetical protein